MATQLLSPNAGASSSSKRARSGTMTSHSSGVSGDGSGDPVTWAVAASTRTGGWPGSGLTAQAHEGVSGGVGRAECH